MRTKDGETILRKEIYMIVEKIFQERSKTKHFKPVKDLVRYAGAVYDHEEINGMFKAILDGWFGVGKYTNRFESRLSRFLNVKKTIMMNSGSSANLIAVSSILSNQLGDNVRLKPGDEVVTPALTFPTTFNPIIQNGLIPVLIDIDTETYNIRSANLEEALSKKTRCILIPHTLGNPNEMDALTELADVHNLFLIEDACDALGSMYNGQYLGTFGDFGTLSFYPAHQITTGEGGAIITKDNYLAEIALSLRDWGRACVMPICNPPHCPDKKCSKSISSEGSIGVRNLPEDYDKRYTYTNIGFNFKPTEIQAAMGLAQLKKIPNFIEARKRNFQFLWNEFSAYEDYFVLPRSLPKSDPCWFAFPLTVKEHAPFKRKDVVQWLTKHNIEVKVMFTGNILRHPAYSKIKCRVAQNLCNSDQIMRHSFFLGVYPGLTEEKKEYVMDVFKEFIKKNK
jgi:CDP-6-deoxy-D-xylo-4-hexulose-3-dehydrase